jgi:hypothetical protein
LSGKVAVIAAVSAYGRPRPVAPVDSSLAPR